MHAYVPLVDATQLTPLSSGLTAPLFRSRSQNRRLQRRGFNIADVVAVLDRSSGYLPVAVARIQFARTNGRRSGDG